MTPLTRSLLSLALVTACVASHAEQSVGPTYEIAEPDLQKAMMDRLKKLEASGEMAKLIDEAKKRSVRTIENPKPVEGLSKAMRNRTYYVDPSVTVREDILDDKGRVVVKGGTRVNPFDYVSLDNWLVFFDGTDAKQVELAHKLGEQYQWRIKPILVNGGPIEIMRRWKKRVYFDQGGFLTRKFGIQAVPAIVTQEGKEMRVDELRY